MKYGSPTPMYCLRWAIINVTLNVLAYESLTTADAPIATFNLVRG
jgi:hypothetical protein